MFLWIALVLDLITAAAFCIAVPSATIFLPLILLAFYVFALFFLVAILFIISLFYSQKRDLEKDNSFCRFLAYHTMEAIVTLFRFRLKGKDLEQIPEGPFVLVCNHLSRFDPMVTTVLMKGRKIAFVSKKENMRIPIVGNITHQIGYLALDRENPLRAMRTIHKAARYVSEKGYTMGIYPEGTRSKNGELGEFKTGAFVMAKKAGVPIAVCAIDGTDCYQKRFSFRSTEITFRFLTLVSSEVVKESSPEELSKLCRNIMTDQQKRPN